MKTERRHELEQNYLADRVGASVEQIAPYGKHIVGAVVAVLLVVFGYSWYSSRALAHNEKAWDLYLQASGMQAPDTGGQNLRRSKLKEILGNKSYAGTAAMAWARLTLAEDELNQGIDLLFTSRSEGVQDIEKARDDFKTVIKESGSLPGKNVLVPRAKVGLARSQESLGEVMEAIKTYKEVEAQFALTAYKGVAQRRITALEKDEAATFYDWLREQEPRRPVAPAGKGEPGLRPDFNPFDKNDPSAFDLDNPIPKGTLTPDFDDLKVTPKKDPSKDEGAKDKEDPKTDDAKKGEGAKDGSPPAKSEKPAEKPAQK